MLHSWTYSFDNMVQPTLKALTDEAQRLSEAWHQDVQYHPSEYPSEWLCNSWKSFDLWLLTPYLWHPTGWSGGCWWHLEPGWRRSVGPTAARPYPPRWWCEWAAREEGNQDAWNTSHHPTPNHIFTSRQPCNDNSYFILFQCGQHRTPVDKWRFHIKISVPQTNERSSTLRETWWTSKSGLPNQLQLLNQVTV